MSSYSHLIILSKNKNSKSNWKIVENKFFSLIKEFYFSEDLLENINCSYSEVLKLCGEYVNEFVGIYKLQEYSKLKKLKNNNYLADETWINENEKYKCNIIFNSDNTNLNNNDILYNDYLTKKENYDNIYVKKRLSYNGNLYDSQSFINYINQQQNELKKLYEQKYEYSNIKKSINYLKLSYEEKENIDNSFNFIDGDIEYSTNTIRVAQSILDIGEYLVDTFDNDILYYIYFD